jgi:hypothetical protein
LETKEFRLVTNLPRLMVFSDLHKTFADSVGLNEQSVTFFVELSAVAF